MLNVAFNFMFVPGLIEQLIFIIDLNYVNLLSVPINQIKMFIQNIRTNFCCGMDKMFVVNPSYVSQIGFNMLKPTFNPVT